MRIGLLSHAEAGEDSVSYIGADSSVAASVKLAKAGGGVLKTNTRNVGRKAFGK